MKCSDCGARIFWVTLQHGERVALDDTPTLTKVRHGFVLMNEKGKPLHPRYPDFGDLHGVYRLHDDSCAVRVAERDEVLEEQKREQEKRKTAMMGRHRA
jgi:hypothetical protein